MTLSFDHVTPRQRVLFGRGAAIDNAVLALADLGATRTMLIAAPSSAPLADGLAARLPLVARVDEVVQHVPVDHADAATTRAEETRADSIVSLGGGSAIGLAKIVALRRRIPLIAIPTTYSGSEATDVWGLTENGVKKVGTDPAILPHSIVYDADLYRSLPPALVGSSALNACAHAVDSLWAPRTDPLNQAQAAAGLQALISGLRALTARGEDDDAAERIIFGAYLAATAFASAGSGLHHKICHVLGGSFGMPHAQTHAVVLPYVTAFNTGAAPRAAASLRMALGTESPASALRDLADLIGAPRTLAELGLAEEDIPHTAQLAAAAAPTSNPAAVTPAALERLLGAAWEGTAP